MSQVFQEKDLLLKLILFTSAFTNTMRKFSCISNIFAFSCRGVRYQYTQAMFLKDTSVTNCRRRIVFFEGKYKEGPQEKYSIIFERKSKGLKYANFLHA